MGFSSVCSLCGLADEEVVRYGGFHLGCYRRTNGRWYDRAYQRVIDGWWLLMNKLFD